MKVSTYWTIVIMMYREYAKKYPQSGYVKKALQDLEEGYNALKDCDEEYDDQETATRDLIRHSRLTYALKYNPDLSFKSMKNARYGKFPVLMGTIYGIPTLLRAIRAAKKA